MVAGLDTWREHGEQCAQFGVILGLSEPVSSEVLEAALRDASYAQNLLISRGERRFLDRLLANPPRAEDSNAPSAVTMATNAAASLSRWAMTGFSTVEDEIYSTRLAACKTCPHLRRPPESRRLLYAAAGVASDERGTCGKCGCVVSAKAKRPRDTCPDPHPTEVGINRWGDAFQPSA